MHATDETDATATGAAGVDVEGGLDGYAPMIRGIECKEIGGWKQCVGCGHSNSCM